MPGRIARRRLRSFDGTRIAYYLAGPRQAAATMVLCPGLGGGVDIWRPFFERFGGRFRLVTWDYRGLYRSGPAANPGRYALADHARDLVALLERERIDSPVLVGWSMGVQVALELHRTHAERAAGLVAIHGTAGRPLETAFGSSLPPRVSPYAFLALRLVGDRFAQVGPWLARRQAVVRSFVWSCQQLGMMASSLDLARFAGIAEEWTRLHLGTYARIFDALGAHDASDLLGRVRSPCLVIAGDADPFTPLAVSRRLADGLPDASLEILPGATHFGLLEFPDRIVDAVERFVDALGAGARPVRRGAPPRPATADGGLRDIG